LLKSLLGRDTDRDEDIGRTIFAYFLLPVLLILVIQKTAITAVVKNHSQFALAAIVILALLYLLLILRALISVNQRSRLGTASYGASGNVAMANLVILLTILYLPVSFLDLASGRTGDAYVPTPADLAGNDTNSKPELHVDNSKAQITLQGEISNGASSRLGELLSNNETAGKPVTRLVLNSDGGNIFEARGMAKLIRDHQIDTHVDVNCLSACTLVFVSGKQRSATASARFGFHAYRLDARYPDVWINVNEQQTRDKELFLSRGVSVDFVENIYSSDPSTLWIPTHARSILVKGKDSINVVFGHARDYTVAIQQLQHFNIDRGKFTGYGNTLIENTVRVTKRVIDCA